MEEIITRLNNKLGSDITLKVRGKIDERDSHIVGIVGSRLVTDYGRRVIKELCRIMLQNGSTVVSGFMYGVDIEVQREIVKAGGRTIGVLGYGLDYIYDYPYSRDLYEKIVSTDCGGVITEFDDKQPPQKWTFPKRNRIVAALSDYLIIIEAGKNSGTLITADLALEMGKDVYVVPGSVFNSQSYGCNKLLSEGAIPLYDFNILSADTPKNIRMDHEVDLSGLSVVAVSIYKEILKHRSHESIDKFLIMKNTIFSVNILNAALSELELSGVIRIAGDNIRLN
jgi:DNA processing protein